LSIPLPVFDRQQAGRQRAAAEAQQARAEYRLARTRAEGELRGLSRQAEALRTAAVDYRSRALAASPELLRIAEAAYRGGESSLLELLDAYRGALESETAALELEKRAREARIEYDLLPGAPNENPTQNLADRHQGQKPSFIAWRGGRDVASRGLFPFHRSGGRAVSQIRRPHRPDKGNGHTDRAATKPDWQGLGELTPRRWSFRPARKRSSARPWPAWWTACWCSKTRAVRPGAPLLHIVSPELGQLQLQLLQTGARATLARQTAQREQKLFEDEVIPQRRVQEAQAALKEAEAAWNQAKAALRLGGMSATTIARIAASGIPQDGITLTAARGGVVTEMMVKPGQRVDAATALLHLDKTDTLGLDIQVPVAESANLATNWPAGTKVEVPDRGITARITSASSMVAAGSQTVVLRAMVEKKTAQLRPGEFVTVALPLGGAKDAWDVPLAAVAHDGKQAYVFIRTSDGFEARPVKATASAGQRVRVQGALKAGEQVAISGVIALKGAWLSGKVDGKGGD
jgi:cobalt-zinc-cadmium efflux system membrane fusion protein